MNTPSSIVTPSQMNVWLEILQLRPIDGVALNLDERADPRAVADPAAVQVDQLGMVNDDVLAQSHGISNHQTAILSVVEDTAAAPVSGARHVAPRRRHRRRLDAPGWCCQLVFEMHHARARGGRT